MTASPNAYPLELDLHAWEVFGLAGALSILIGDRGEGDPQAEVREQAINALADVLPRHAEALHKRIFALELTEADLRAAQAARGQA